MEPRYLAPAAGVSCRSSSSSCQVGHSPSRPFSSLAKFAAAAVAALYLSVIPDQAHALINGNTINPASSITIGTMTIVNATNRAVPFSIGISTFMIRAGKVGIGTTNPDHMLTIYAPASSVAGLDIYNSDNSNRLTHNLFTTSNEATLSMNDASGTTAIKLNAGTAVNSFFNGANLGIGTTNPTSKLMVSQTKNDTVSYANSAAVIGDQAYNSGLVIQSLLSAPYGIAMQGLNAVGDSKLPLILNPLGGNVSVGTTNPGARLHAQTGTGDQFAIKISSQNGSTDFISVSRTGVFTHTANGSDGVWFWGTELGTGYETNGTATLAVNYNGYHDGATQFRDTWIGNGKSALLTHFDGVNGQILYGPLASAYRSTYTIASGGLALAGGATAYSLTQGIVKSCTLGTTTDANGMFNGCVASDRLLKTAVVPLAYNPGLIDGLRPVAYKWTDKSNRDKLPHAGFIAQDVEKVLPQAVVPAGQGLKGVDPNAIIAALVAEVQQLRRRVAALEQKKQPI